MLAKRTLFSLLKRICSRLAYEDARDDVELEIDAGNHVIDHSEDKFRVSSLVLFNLLISRFSADSWELRCW